MALEIGSIVEGTVTGIAKFGAFVELPDKKVGLVHISEVANEYVNDVNDYLKVHDKVKVKVLSVDDKGKIALSIKQTQAPAPREKRPDRFHRGGGDHNREGRPQGSFREGRPAGGFREGRTARPQEGRPSRPAPEYRPARRHEGGGSFEDKLSRFLKDSDERLLDLKRNVESKRGGRGARRSD